MKYSSLYNMLKINAEKYGDKEAVLYDTISITYTGLFEDAVKKAMHLSRFEGKEIAIYGPASYRWIVNVFGTILAGKDAVLIDFFAPGNIRRAKLDMVGIDYVLCSTNQYVLSDREAIIISGADKEIVSEEAYTPVDKEGNIIMYSATEDDGDKPCVVTTKNIMAALELVNTHISCDSSDKLLSQIELCQMFGFIYGLMWPLSNGACVCVGRGLRHIDADTYYYRPTILPGTPSVLDYLKRISSFNPELKMVVIGGAPCPYRLYEFLCDRDIEVYTIYGGVENTGTVGINSLEDGTFKLMSPDMVELAEDGEILVKGECVAAGYYNDTMANEKHFPGGVYHTGDYGRINASGNLVITRRNPGIIHLPTGAKICKRMTSQEISDLNGIAEAYVVMCEEKLSAAIVPINKEARPEKFKRLIAGYNEMKGYRFEIQKLALLDSPLPRLESGEINEAEIMDIISASEYDLVK